MSATETVSAATISPNRTRLFLLTALPILLLGGVIALFALTNGAGLNVKPAAPIESVEFGRTVLEPGKIQVHLRNTGQEDVTIAQVAINDAIWPFNAPRTTLSRLGSTTLTLDYPWVKGQAYTITLFSSNSVAFVTDIPVASETAHASGGTLWKFTLVGAYVGIIPVILGMFWLPVLGRMGPRFMLFLMAATVGLLVFLGIDATSEALEQAGALGGPFQGTGLIGIGIVGTWMLLDALGKRPAAGTQTESNRRFALAWMIAIGIGLHNFGEGLAIGAAYTLGAAALGTFLVIGFIIQNITEGLGILVPIARERPTLRTLALLSLVGGGPAILGAWAGGLITAPAFSVLFLAIGAGAVFQVAFSIGRHLVWNSGSRKPMPMTAFAGVMAGMLALFITGLLVK
jgi:ZIP family zinc transporter